MTQLRVNGTHLIKEHLVLFGQKTKMLAILNLGHLYENVLNLKLIGILKNVN